MPMCDQSTECNPRWHIRSRESTIKRVHWVAPDLINHTQDCHGSTMRNVTFKKPAQLDRPSCPVRNRAPLTARSSSLRCDRQPSTRLQNNTPKLLGQNPESIPQEALCHETLARTSSRYQVLSKLLWKLSEDASQITTGPKHFPAALLIQR